MEQNDIYYYENYLKEQPTPNKTEFTVYEDIFNKDSMLFDSETLVATVKTPENYICSLEVVGEVKVCYQDEIYKSFSQMPEKLKEKFVDGSVWQDENIVIDNNNWFEIKYAGDGAVLECEVSSVNNLYEVMADYINKCDYKETVPKELNADVIFYDSYSCYQENTKENTKTDIERG